MEFKELPVYEGSEQWFWDKVFIKESESFSPEISAKYADKALELRRQRQQKE